MIELDAHKALFARWIINWPLKVGGTQDAPTIPYALEDRALVEPVPAVFAVVEITNLDGDQATMGQVGKRKYLRMGFFDVKLYGPRGQGRLQLDQLAGYVKDLYESTTIGVVTDQERGIRTYTSSAKPQKNDKEYPQLRCVLVRTPFEYFERR